VFFLAFLDQLNQLKLLGHLQELFAISNHIYLIIDGINNELCDTEGQTITEFLFTNLHRLPIWLKLIITMNRLDNDQHQTEQNTFLQNFVLLDMEDDSRFANHLHNDIREYLSKRLEVRSRNFVLNIFVFCRIIVVMNYMIYHHRYQILINCVFYLGEIYFLFSNFVIYLNNEDIQQIWNCHEH
jgi:hypothetical protein